MIINEHFVHTNLVRIPWKAADLYHGSPWHINFCYSHCNLIVNKAPRLCGPVKCFNFKMRRDVTSCRSHNLLQVQHVKINAFWTTKHLISRLDRLKAYFTSMIGNEWRARAKRIEYHCQSRTCMWRGFPYFFKYTFSTLVQVLCVWVERYL